MAIVVWLQARRATRVLLEGNRLLAMLAEREAVVAERERSITQHLEQIANLSVREAREQVEALAVQRSADHTAQIVASAEREAAAEVAARTQWLVVGAMARLVADPNGFEFATLVDLPQDKGLRARLVGVNGGNIQEFERITGVELKLEEPRQAVLTAFDPLRRHVAARTLNKLLSRGRIFPSSIRAAFDETMRTLPSELLELGAAAAEAAHVTGLSDEISGMMGRLHFQWVDGRNALHQAVVGAKVADSLTRELGASNPDVIRRAAFLRDVGQAISMDVPSHHADIGAVFAAQQGEASDVCDAIRSHHSPIVWQATISAALVACADRIATRASAGQRYQAPRVAVERLRGLESHLESVEGVAEARILGMASEAFVFVNPSVVDDAGLPVLTSQLIAKLRERTALPITLTLIRQTGTEVRLDREGTTRLREITGPDRGA